jgi:hypothetical protein
MLADHDKLKFVGHCFGNFVCPATFIQTGRWAPPEGGQATNGRDSLCVHESPARSVFACARPPILSGIPFLTEMSIQEDDLAMSLASIQKESEDRIDAFERGELPAVDGPPALQDLRSSL